MPQLITMPMIDETQATKIPGFTDEELGDEYAAFLSPGGDRYAIAIRELGCRAWLQIGNWTKTKRPAETVATETLEAMRRDLENYASGATKMEG